MNKDILQGQWHQLKGQVRQWWGRLTDDDVEAVGGDAEKLLGALQKRYGYSRERAEEELEQHLGHFEAEAGSRMRK
jgi:uncharacterized protein YjbJ (UPF0337 family)